MFGFLKRGKPQSGMVPPFYFKDGVSALEYACKYMTCTLAEKSMLPALVLDARELFGTKAAVKVEADGVQLATLRVASDDGGFIVLARTAGPKGPMLQPGQLVAWQAAKYESKVAGASNDKRFGWIGFIVGTLKPHHVNGGWVGDEKFLP